MIGMEVRGDTLEVVARATTRVEWADAFAELDTARFPMLAALTPYGDAVFNGRQVPLLTAELDRMPAAWGGDWVEQARAMCRIVEAGSHLYLWFVGD
ncbi:hypothetical protein [Streptomyces sp. NPDC060198]|uniref:hypothetical protein n=1 Tax=Streptomyces sp. NPDC060198 TaxID=3347070 RepID=UPI003656DAF6